MSAARTLTGHCVDLKLGMIQGCCFQYSSAACATHTLAAETLDILPCCWLDG